ncbi:MAG: hypothetical protein SWX82_01530 [Cyanobacteriota bacterium]|nr:hypothetical protein [Cyanobacteriota bacterium]
MPYPQQRGEVNIFPSHTGNYGASENEMTIAASATKRGGRYFPHNTPEITVLQKMNIRENQLKIQNLNLELNSLALKHSSSILNLFLIITSPEKEKN